MKKSLAILAILAALAAPEAVLATPQVDFANPAQATRTIRINGQTFHVLVKKITKSCAQGVCVYRGSWTAMPTPSQIRNVQSRLGLRPGQKAAIRKDTFCQWTGKKLACESAVKIEPEK